MIEYNNYVGKKTDSKFKSHYTLTDLGRTRQNENYTYRFTIIPEENSQFNAASLFATYATADGMFENSFLFSPGRIESVQETLRSVYLYSYIKSVYYGFGIVQKNINAMMLPGNSLCFFGHKMLFELITNGYMQEFTPPSNIISMQIDLEEDVSQLFSDWEIWPRIFNSQTGQVFNAEYETVLSLIKNKGAGRMEVDNIGIVNSSQSKNLRSVPLGNMIYSNDMQQLLFIETPELQSDKPSFYFGKAVMLAAVEIPSIDADDEIYDTILVSNYDSFGLSFEVQSITGFNPFMGPISASDNAGYTRPDDTIPPGYGSSGMSGNGGTNPGINGRNDGNRGRGPKQTSSTQLNMVKERVTKFGSSAVSILRRLDDIVTDDKIMILADIISDITGKNIRPKSIKRGIGKSLGSVLSDFGVDLSDRISGSFEEYDAFYGETRYQNGIAHVELVGRPRQIKGPTK